MPSAAAATAARPSTIATGERSIHLPKSPANPNRSTAACSAASALPRDIQQRRTFGVMDRIVPPRPSEAALR